MVATDPEIVKRTKELSDDPNTSDWLKGYHAFCVGDSSNPYPSNTRPHVEWDDGWQHAATIAAHKNREGDF